MRNHPFFRSVPGVLVILSLSLIVGLLVTGLIIYYQTFTKGESLGIGYSIAFIWLVGFYYNWHMADYVRVWQAKAVVGIMQQLVSLLLLYFLFVPTGIIYKDDFIRILPLIGLGGFLLWVIVIFWYDTKRIEKAIDNLPESTFSQEIVMTEKTIDTLSVKDGVHIHIIPVEEIFFIQACGDYINIFTREGQFVKEQTMKSLENSLPDNFVRIHRSSIINSMQLLRIELFGKENYHVLLKNGSTIKASLTGYKLLKSRLGL